MVPPVRLGLLATTVLLAASSCRSGSGAPDAAVDYMPVDIITETNNPPLVLDFSATGCTTLSLTEARCDGVAPLTLTFTPVASEGIEQFLWDFGDSTPPSTEAAPTHTYRIRGSFTVTLVGGGATGTLSREHKSYVNVAGAPAGALCDVDTQCAPPLTCWCGSSAPCAPSLGGGFCSQPCESADATTDVCPTGSACGDLSAGAGVAGAADGASAAWRRPLCLPTCASDAACAPGFSCRQVPAAGTNLARWMRVCFASYPFDVGARCADASGTPIDGDCVGHLCADLGAFGRCSVDCTTAACPEGASCAHLGDGRALCLGQCGPALPCNDDPLLDCELPGSPGGLGFTVPGSAPTTTYCAPRRCTTSADCTPAGTCSGGHCARVSVQDARPVPPEPG